MNMYNVFFIKQATYKCQIQGSPLKYLIHVFGALHIPMGTTKLGNLTVVLESKELQHMHWQELFWALLHQNNGVRVRFAVVFKVRFKIMVRLRFNIWSGVEVNKIDRTGYWPLHICHCSMWQINNHTKQIEPYRYLSQEQEKNILNRIKRMMSPNLPTVYKDDITISDLFASKRLGNGFLG